MFMKIQEIREMSDDELRNKIVENKETLANLKFQNVTTKVQDTSQFGKIRKEIARMKTILRERELNIKKIAKKKVS